MSILENETVISAGLIAFKTACLLLLLAVLKFVTQRLAKTKNPVFEKIDRMFMYGCLPLGLAMVSLSFVHGICSLYSIEQYGWLPFIIGFICIAVILIAISGYCLDKMTEKENKNKKSGLTSDLNKFDIN